MEADAVPETVVSTALTLQDVLSAGGGLLTQEQFNIIAEAAEDEAAETSGKAEEKFNVFSAKLVQFCETFGDPIARRLVLVAYPDLRGFSKWTFNHPGSRLFYFATGIDKYRYVAAVYP